MMGLRGLTLNIIKNHVYTQLFRWHPQRDFFGAHTCSASCPMMPTYNSYPEVNPDTPKHLDTPPDDSQAGHTKCGQYLNQYFFLLSNFFWITSSVLTEFLPCLVPQLFSPKETHRNYINYKLFGL